MNINAISGNYYNTHNTKGYTSSPNFRGELSNAQMAKSLGMLKERVSCVQLCSTMNDVKSILSTLMQKFKGLGLTVSSGMLVIPEEKLAEFLGARASIYNLEDLVGICAAVGDNYGSVENWTKAYETIVALLPKEIFR